MLGGLLLAGAPKLARAADYCAGGPETREAARTPPELAAKVAALFGISAEMAGEATMARCVGPELLACWVGANLNCGKADTRRSSPAASAYCRENPGADVIPMVVAGHDTIYEWRCAGRRAVAGKAMVTVDPQGFVADNWKPAP